MKGLLEIVSAAPPVAKMHEKRYPGPLSDWQDPFQECRCASPTCRKGRPAIRSGGTATFETQFYGKLQLWICAIAKYRVVFEKNDLAKQWKCKPAEFGAGYFSREIHRVVTYVRVNLKRAHLFIENGPTWGM